MTERFVIYQCSISHKWEAAAEYTMGRWPFKKKEHAPIFHADTPGQVFAWLLSKYPDQVIAYDPTVTARYKELGNV